MTNRDCIITLGQIEVLEAFRAASEVYWDYFVGLSKLNVKVHRFSLDACIRRGWIETTSRVGPKSYRLSELGRAVLSIHAAAPGKDGAR